MMKELVNELNRVQNIKSWSGQESKRKTKTVNGTGKKSKRGQHEKRKKNNDT